MKTLLASLALLLVPSLSLAAAPATQPDNTPPPGFKALFTGTDLTNWKVPEGDNGHWRVVNGIIDYDGKSEGKKDKDLWSAETYGDFTMQVDWRWSGPAKKVKHPHVLPDGTHKKDAAGAVIQEEVMEAGDSGIYVRGNSKSQINIWCWNCGSGEVYGYRMDAKMPPDVIAGVTPKRNMDKPIGEWNKMEITMKGDRLSVSLNGEEVITNAKLPGVPAKGPVALQHHGDAIQFKNIYIKTLGE